MSTTEIRSLLEDREKFNEFSNNQFKRFDKDGSGHLCIAEVEEALMDFSVVTGIRKFSLNKVKRFFRAYDDDKNGRFDLNEFRDMSTDLFNSYIYNPNELYD